MKKILMIAFQFPPFHGGSGIHRILKFVRYLPEFGWLPMVLSANSRAYPRVDEARLKEIPEGVIVRRAFALDTSRHLAVRNMYSEWMALPDRWVSWWFGALVTGLRMIREHRPDVLWSTFPIPTAHLIGYTLHRLTGIPWVSDFRDVWAENDPSLSDQTKRFYRWIERLTLTHCERAVFTTQGALTLSARQYPNIPGDRFTVIPNGYDEEDFVSAETSGMETARRDGVIVLLHSGVLYDVERDPRWFFAALSRMKKRGEIVPGDVRVVLRGSGFEDHYRNLIREEEIGDIVFTEPLLPFRSAISEMLMVDGLLVFQGSFCNQMVPAKLYEYFRAGRPILGLVDPEGDTARVLREAGISTVARIDSTDQIEESLRGFLSMIREGKAPVPSREVVERNSRRSRTRELAWLLDSIGSARLLDKRT